jgi:hypothetical protein
VDSRRRERRFEVYIMLTDPSTTFCDPSIEIPPLNSAQIGRAMREFLQGLSRISKALVRETLSKLEPGSAKYGTDRELGNPKLTGDSRAGTFLEPAHHDDLTTPLRERCSELGDRVA